MTVNTNNECLQWEKVYADCIGFPIDWCYIN